MPFKYLLIATFGTLLFISYNGTAATTGADLSQKKTELAITNNKFNEELVKINHNGNILDIDEHPRIGLKITDLEKLKTVFQQNGTVTPGNSSGINDGAAALLLTSLEEAKKNLFNR